ncbi:MAG: hypothetical protein H0U91_05850 [Rubrobacter sp.]|nr:hypothetical protein [Rubrobacter sp.]
MRRMAVVLAAVLALVATSGAALADGIQGNGGDNRLVGTNDTDNISGGGGDDDIFGKGDRDRLFGDAGADDIRGGNGGDRLQGGLGPDDLFGQNGNDFVNAIDGQTNDFVDCGDGEFDVAGIDVEGFGGPEGDVEGFGVSPSDTDIFALNCEAVYLGIGPISTGPIGEPGPIGGEARSGPGTDLSAIDTLEEAEQAEADGLLRQIR